MTFKDIIALARAGYTKKDIDDLLNKDIDIDENHFSNLPPENADDQQEIEEDESEDTPADEPSAPDERDEEIRKLKEQIAKLQKDNQKKDLSDKNVESDEDILAKIALDFL